MSHTSKTNILETQKPFSSQGSRFILSIIAIALVLFTAISAFIYLNQKKQILDTKKEELSVEANLIGGFISDYLLRNDYSEARRLLSEWPNTHQHVSYLEIILDNGKPLFSFQSPTLSKHDFKVEQISNYGKRSVKVRLSHDMNVLEQNLRSLFYQLMSFALMVTVLAGYLMWYVLFRWTVKPMELEIKRRTQELQISEARFRRLTENAKDMIYRMSLPEGRYEYVSPAAKALFGYAPEDFYHHPILIKNAIHPDWNSYFQEQWINLLAGNMPPTYEYQIIHKTGEARWLHQRNVLVKDQQQKPIAIEGIVTDITERKETEQRLYRSLQIIENTSEGIVVTSPDGYIVDINQAYTQILGYQREELVGKRTNMIRSGYHDKVFYQKMWEALINKGQWAGEIWDRRKNGEVFPIWLNINAIRDNNGTIINYIGIFSDITQQKASEAALHNMAFYDPLTELPNRALFHNRLQHEMETASREKEFVSLLFIDLDHFKWTNDTMGHAAGDKLLKIVAQRLKKVVRESDTVARLGGDEFTIILPGLGKTNRISILVQELMLSIKKPITIDEQVLHVGASIGIAIYPSDGQNINTLLKHADQAMYQAKEAGRHTFRFYSEKTNTRAFDHIALDHELRQAFQEKEFTLYYQPKVNAKNGCIVGMEALIRWIKKDHTVVPPNHFIPLAEETGLIIPLGRWIMESACKQIAKWNTVSNKPLKMSVNLSAVQFQDKELIETIQTVIEKTAIEPETIELELTESMVMGDVEAAIETMNSIRKLGVNLAIDDFGTGYSSLSYLKRFPIQTLKIDKSFVNELTHDNSDAAIIEAIISMAKSLQLDVVAEGVETEEQLNFLRKKGCNELQGYYLGKPLPGDELYALFKNNLNTLVKQIQ